MGSEMCIRDRLYIVYVYLLVVKLSCSTSVVFLFHVKFSGPAPYTGSFFFISKRLRLGLAAKMVRTGLITRTVGTRSNLSYQLSFASVRLIAPPHQNLKQGAYDSNVDQRVRPRYFLD